jgi:hypothetical protein
MTVQEEYNQFKAGISVNEINQVNKMSKQTAIEWLQERLLLSLSNELKSLNGFFVIAKEMEKEQIMEAFKHGELPPLFVNFNAEKYYNETYEKEEK